MIELLPLFLFASICLVLTLGYPVAFTLAGVSLIFAAFGIIFGVFDAYLLLSFPERIFGILTNPTLIAVPLFVFMGVVFERSRLAEELLRNMARLFSGIPSGAGISVIIVGMMLAACTGIVGATVVTMGMMSLPTMLKKGYAPELATGVICATGTLGQIIPPSIALILLGDVLSNAYQQAQLNSGVFNAKTLSVGDLFVAAIVPGLMLVGAYILYMLCKSGGTREPSIEVAESDAISLREALVSAAPPFILIVLVLGSIIGGFATPTEASALGALAALCLAKWKKALNLNLLRDATDATAKTTAMVFAILMGASVFSLVFRGFDGEHLIASAFNALPGGMYAALFAVMLAIFVLGFILDFIEITFVVIPIVGPVLLMMGVDPIWLGILIALNLQTSFLTPPFGFALFYLRGVAPDTIATSAIYRGVIPFILIQLGVICMVAIWPSLVTWLPEKLL